MILTPALAPILARRAKVVACASTGNTSASAAAYGAMAGLEVIVVLPKGKIALGKLDLVIDLNFRMDTSALYSDIVLPAATWYEKDDLNTTDLHSFIHPLSAAVPPCWESKSDWQIFRAIAEKKVKEIVLFKQELTTTKIQVTYRDPAEQPLHQLQDPRRLHIAGHDQDGICAQDLRRLDLAPDDPHALFADFRIARGKWIFPVEAG